MLGLKAGTASEKMAVALDLTGMMHRHAVLLLVSGLALGLVGCSQKADSSDSGGPVAPSAADVERDAIAGFINPQSGQTPPNTAASFDGPFTAGGFEPYWSGRFADGKFTFSRPEADPVIVDVGRLAPKAGLARVTKGKLGLIVAAQPCTDPSGSKLDYRVLVTYDGEAYEGCARVGDAPVVRDWGAFIDDFLPAIDACISTARSKGLDGVRVTIAYPRTEGLTGVRLSDASGGRWECDAESRAGGGVKFFDSISDENDVHPGEWSPLFTRAPGLAPMGECFRSEPAKAANGATLGWLTYEAC